MLNDTIVAPSTPPGKGGIGIVRISGPKVRDLAIAWFGSLPKPRYARYQTFLAEDGTLLDLGLVLFFPAPASFTGEDTLELHCHGSPVVIQTLIKRIMTWDIRLAKPGEFSERAFLNDKIDLAQAEAIADLIHSSSEQAARSALRSLQGDFSRQIHTLVEVLIHLRVYIEATLDFPEEEVTELLDNHCITQSQALLTSLRQIQNKAKQGCLLQEGMTVVIAGYPNVGKSTLLNLLSGQDTAIVTDVPGTTRDLMQVHVLIDGLPIHLIDTAGIRDSDDKVEQEGIRRAWEALQKADLILLIGDVRDKIETLIADFQPKLPAHLPITLVLNKIDLLNRRSSITYCKDYTVIALSAKTEEGINLLKEHLKSMCGYESTVEIGFSARQRHLEALTKAENHILLAQSQWQYARAQELFAEELKLAQDALGEIIGKFTSDDLLGKIFSTFCIGK